MQKETTTIRLPPQIKAEMQEEAESYGISLNSYMLTAMKLGRKVLKEGLTCNS